MSCTILFTSNNASSPLQLAVNATSSFISSLVGITKESVCFSISLSSTSIIPLKGCGGLSVFGLIWESYVLLHPLEALVENDIMITGGSVPMRSQISLGLSLECFPIQIEAAVFIIATGFFGSPSYNSINMADEGVGPVLSYMSSTPTPATAPAISDNDITALP